MSWRAFNISLFSDFFNKFIPGYRDILICNGKSCYFVSAECEVFNKQNLINQINFFSAAIYHVTCFIYRKTDFVCRVKHSNSLPNLTVFPSICFLKQISLMCNAASHGLLFLTVSLFLYFMRFLICLQCYFIICLFSHCIC